MGCPDLDMVISKFEVGRRFYCTPFEIREGRVPNEVTQNVGRVIVTILSAANRQVEKTCYVSSNQNYGLMKIWKLDAS